MSTSITDIDIRTERKRLAAFVAVIAALAVLATALTAAAPAGAATEPYAAFVTDFPAAATAPQPFIPHVTDFPRPAVTPTALPMTDDGTDWASRLGSNEAGAAIVAALGALLLVMTVRANPVNA